MSGQREADDRHEDPFADLAEHFAHLEEEFAQDLRYEPAVGSNPGRPAPVAGEETGADLSHLDMDGFDAALGAELEAELKVSEAAAPAAGEPARRYGTERPAPHPQAANYARWVALRPARTLTPSAPRSDDSRAAGVQVDANAASAETPLETAQEHSAMVAALDGLSAPATPRGGHLGVAEPFAPARDTPAPEPRAFDEFDRLIAAELAAMQSGSSQAPVAATSAPSQAAHEELEDRRTPTQRGGRAARGTSGVRRKAGQGGLQMRHLGAAAAIVLMGGALYSVAGSMLNTTSDEVLIVAADDQPVRVRPQDPGGRAIPNQSKAVYERVQSPGENPVVSQKRLVVATQEPSDLPADDVSSLPGVDLTPVGTAFAAESAPQPDVYAEAEPEAVLTPRRVRTRTVLPDGTLAPATPAPEAPAAEVPAPESAQASLSRAEDTAPAETPAVSTDVPAQDDLVRAVAMTGAASDDTPETTGSVSPADADEMVVAAITPAAAAPEPAAPAADFSGWYVQISSQPSEESAKASSADLGQRYASILGGHERVIQAADIPGKGTFYRVRLPIESKSEADGLCNNLKSAGGSCFVAR